ncbi:hypothetical protein ACJIZ3_020458 [Penstemon smallii]|uniref:Small ribosomal subunit protein uS8c n=1 Tax=Penstemon smallii TaxID=265156 RepID=A0ABD3SIS7_9LAMI
MFGGSGKLGRGVGKRNIHALPISRLSPAGGRLSLGGGRGGTSSSGGPSTSSMESFSLLRENPLNFAMAIKLAPDLVDEIKRVEAQGGTARIKFDVNPNNSNGNVINVGDKNFKFTWSREIPDLCDVYEERQSGEGGNGLLVESGASWRKLNVQRVLDESTKNHVKMRSEEADRKNKSRKAIVLDPQIPSMKNQMKAFAAAESNPWRNFKHKKEPPSKKLKSEPTPAVGPPNSVYKSGLSTTTISRGKHASSSPSYQAEQYGASPSPLGGGKKKHASVPDVPPAQNINKTGISDKEMHRRLLSSTSGGKSKQNHNTEVKPSDLRSLMISLLLDQHSTGMSLKALEKAVGDAMPNSPRQFEPILKQIATFQAPGRYFLKPGVDMESFKKPPSEIESSPKVSHNQSPAPQKFDQLSAQNPSISSITALNNEEQIQLNPTPEHAPDTIGKVDILHNSSDHIGKKEVSEISEGLAVNSSDSGSDSDSDSDSSDSGSHSKSKSRSPVGSRSGSSSDSESDASSRSKQASDEDVDIMSSDDDKESKHKLQNSSKSKSPYSEPVDIGNYENQDDHVSNVVEIEKDPPEDNHETERAANYSFSNKEGEEPVEYSPGYHEQQHREVYDRKLDGPHSGVSSSFKPGQSGSHEKLSKGKSKRRSDDKHSDDRPHNSKKLKSKNSSLSHPPSSQTGDNRGIPTRPTSDLQQEGKRSFEASSSGEKRPGKHDILGGGVNKYSERIPQSNESLRINKRFDKEAHNEDSLSSERRPTKIPAEGIGEIYATLTESHYRKPELLGKVQEAGPHSNSNTGYSPKNKNTSNIVRSPEMNALGNVLRRKISELELGEFREPPSCDKNAGPEKQFERKSSFKQLENRPMDSERRNSDSSITKHFNKIIADSRKLSPPNTEAVVHGISDRSSNRKVQDHNVDGPTRPDGPSKRKVLRYGDDLTRPHSSATRPPQQHQSCGDHTEVASQQNNVQEMNSKSRYAEAGTGHGASLEACVDTSRKLVVNATEQHQPDPIQGVIPHSIKESKKQKPNKAGDSSKQNVASLTGSNDGGEKRRGSSWNENSCSYTKYEKEEPELKGPIKDASQYEEYVKDYQEKYESYCSLKKILESYSDEFSNLGKDLEAYSGRDIKKYHDILGQIRSSFLQYGEALRTIVNAEKRGFASTELNPISNGMASFLQIMKYRGYIKDFKVHDPHRVGRITVQLLGRVKDCRAITYRQDIKADQLESYKTRALPTHQWGYVVITTPNGVLDHEEAIRQNVGGQVLGYFY